MDEKETTKQNEDEFSEVPIPGLRRKLKGTEKENRELRKKLDAMEQRLEAITLRELRGGGQQVESIDEIAREDPVKAIGVLKKQIDDLHRQYQNDLSVRGQAERIRSAQQESFMRAAQEYKELMDPNADFFQVYHEAWKDEQQKATDGGYSLAISEDGPERLAREVDGEIARQKRIAADRTTPAKTTSEKKVVQQGLEGSGGASGEDTQRVEEARKKLHESANETEREDARQFLLARLVPERLKGK